MDWKRAQQDLFTGTTSLSSTVHNSTEDDFFNFGDTPVADLAADCLDRECGSYLTYTDYIA